MFKTRLRLTLTILGFMWGVISYFFRVMRADGTPRPDEAIVTLPATIAAFLFGWLSDLYMSIEKPAFLVVLLFLILFVLSTVFVGAVIGFASAVFIEKLASFFHRVLGPS